MGYGLFSLNCRTNLGILTLTLTKRVQAAILTAAIPTNASEKAQLTLTLTLTLTVILTLTLTHFSPSPNPIPNSNLNPLHHPFRNVGIAAVGIAAASQQNVIWTAPKSNRFFLGPEQMNVSATVNRIFTVYSAE